MWIVWYITKYTTIVIMYILYSIQTVSKTTNIVTTATLSLKHSDY